MEITRKEFLKRTGLAALAGVFAVKSATSAFAAVPVNDNLGTDNQDALAAEIVARTEADTAEAQARQTAVDNEATARSLAVGAEADTRSAADTALSNRIGVQKGSALRPVYVDANGNVTQCNIWVE